MKKLSIIVVTIIVVGLMYAYPHIMLNPGELSNGHQNVKSDCLACHKPFWGISNEKCISCHKVSEIGSKKNDSTKLKKILFHQNLTYQECSFCHSDHVGLNPLNLTSKFSHELVSENIISNCVGCHEIPSGIKHSKYKRECKNCHITDKWTRVQNFKHEFIAENEVNNCSSCHNNPGDELHSGISENCSFCHGTSGWKPSSFDHSSKFILDSDHNTKCITCHTNNKYKTYTCYGCHEHSPSKIADEHIEEGINNFEDCVTCHKSADEHDIKGGKDEDNSKEKIKEPEHDENDDDD
jgi:hypothetical protein